VVAVSKDWVSVLLDAFGHRCALGPNVAGKDAGRGVGDRTPGGF
jgi:hypothetical protein